MSRTINRVRAYWSIRSAHLERARELEPAAIVYGKANYDFDETLTTDLELIHAPTGAAAVSALRSMPALSAVEVNEPLGLSSLKWTVPIVAALSLRRRTPVTIVCYAIENLDPFELPVTGPKGRVKRMLERRASRFVAKRIDRIVWGTTASRDLYTSELGGSLPTEQVVVPALPCACPCLDDTPTETRAARLLFVGALTPRKGFDQLLRVWPEVAATVPDATLTIVGKGPGEASALELAANDTRVTVVIDPPRAQVHAELRAATALVLLSQRTPRWREQVGLPIVEGLSHGCEVITTSETGLADWLADHGHHVVAPDAPDDLVATAIAEALRFARPSEEILAQLPAEDGRLAADRWMFSSSPTSPAD